MKKDRQVKSSLSWYMLGGIFCVLLLYTSMQYFAFKKNYHQLLIKDAAYVEKTYRNFLENYKMILEKIALEIKENDLFANKQAIEDIIKKAYAYGIEGENNIKFRVSGITWIGTEGTKLTPLGRLGEVKHTLEFPAQYLKKLANNEGAFETSDVENSATIPYLNLGIGVQDNHKKYRGFVNARVNLGALKEALISKYESGVQFILLNEKEQEILSSLPEGFSFKDDLGMRELSQEIFKGNFSERHYVFSHQLPVNGFPYVLRFGFDQRQFYLFFLQQNYLYFILFLLSLCSFAFFTYYYHKKFIKKALKFYKAKNREKNLAINHFLEENRRLSGREKELEHFIKSSESANRAEKNFYLEINERVSQSLSRMLDISNFLLNKIQEDNKIEENSKELMEIFEHTYTHSRFFTLKREEELISINDVLDEVLVVFSKQILKKELQVNIQKGKVITMLTDKTVLKQALINILGSAIKNSPRKGEISLKLSLQGEGILMECRDKGYLGEQQSVAVEKSLSLDCMALEKSDMEKLVKSLGGVFSAHYKPYEGNTFLLQLPCLIRESRGSIDEQSNNIDNIVSFAAMKKRRDL